MGVVVPGEEEEEEEEEEDLMELEDFYNCNNPNLWHEV